MSLQNKVVVEIENELDLERWFEMGGPGSGNWGHRGRKGKRGGSMPGGGKAGEKLFAPVGDAGESGNRGLDMLLSEQGRRWGHWETVPVGLWADAPNGIRADLKAQVAKDLSEKTGIPEEDCADFVKQWAHSSNDDDMRSLAIQKDAAEEFGVKTSEFTQGKFEVLDRTVKNAQAKELKGLQEEGLSLLEAEEHMMDYWRLPKHMQPLMDSPKQKALLRAMYDRTQADLKERGIKEVRLSRGARFPKEQTKYWQDQIGDNVSIETNSVESWSVNRRVAGMFAGSGGKSTDYVGVRFETVVPAERILSTPASGFGCLTEGEVVVLGGTEGDAARISGVY